MSARISGATEERGEPEVPSSSGSVDEQGCVTAESKMHDDLGGRDTLSSLYSTVGVMLKYIKQLHLFISEAHEWSDDATVEENLKQLEALAGKLPCPHLPSPHLPPHSSPHFSIDKPSASGTVNELSDGGRSLSSSTASREESETKKEKVEVPADLIRSLQIVKRTAPQPFGYMETSSSPSFFTPLIWTAVYFLQRPDVCWSIKHHVHTAIASDREEADRR
eukprot:GHVN01076443.1.p1 GENE.GHVN01076443.1~~GHVN01076443.1.p1  ORF type:complete len:221 (-),score=56.91 GHVN01076443.1:1638-2300(-)